MQCRRMQNLLRIEFRKGCLGVVARDAGVGGSRNCEESAPGTRPLGVIADGSF